MKQLFIAVLAMVIAVTATAQKGLAVGTKAPDFTGIDQNGKTVSLKSALKNGTVALLFYRGYWCPNCSRLLKSVQDSLSQLSAQKVTVIAVSPETSEGVSITVKNSGATFSVISDKNLAILKKYDVAFTITKEMDDIHKKYKIDVEGNNGANGKILPRPSAFIINQKGIITYRYFNTDPYSNPNSNKRITVKEILEKSSK